MPNTLTPFRAIPIPAEGDDGWCDEYIAFAESYDQHVTHNGIVTGTAFSPSGLTGAVAASRYAGATASGAPASGTFAVGDYVIDRTGAIFVCTGAGTPGTWTRIGGDRAPSTAKYITSEAHSDLSAEIVIPGLAASADIASAGGAGFSQEFDSGASPFTWSSAPATENVNSTAKSHYYAEVTDTTERFGRVAWTPGGAFDVRAKISCGWEETASGMNLECALHIQDSANTSRIEARRVIGFGYAQAAGWSYASGIYTQQSTITWDFHPTDLYLRITRDGSNTIKMYLSTNGIIWQALTPSFALTLTVSHWGLRIKQSTASKGYYALDWVRSSV